MTHSAFYRRFRCPGEGLERIRRSLDRVQAQLPPIHRLQLIQSREEADLGLVIGIDTVGNADMPALGAQVDAALAASGGVAGAIEGDALELIVAKKQQPAAHHRFIALPNMEPSAATYDAFFAMLTQGMDMVIRFDPLLELYLYRRPGTRWLFIYETWMDFAAFEPIRYQSHMAGQAERTVALAQGPVRIDYCDLVRNYLD